jgi:Uma2 family endonuclease
MIGGQRFTRPERTPFLKALIDTAQAALETALHRVNADGNVLRDADVLLSSATVTIPDLALYAGPTANIPDVIVEYRAESTDRLFFGAKRLAYARAHVPEVWFVDAVKFVVTVLRLEGNLDYPWPAATFGVQDAIVSSAIGGLVVPANALLGAKV